LAKAKAAGGKITSISARRLGSDSLSTAAASPGFVGKLKDRKEVAEGTMAFRFEKLSGWTFKTALNCCQCLVSRAGSDGRRNTIWYKAIFKGGVYEVREKVWAFGGAEEGRVASLEGRADVA
jgi:hypothetical protein